MQFRESFKDRLSPFTAHNTSTSTGNTRKYIYCDFTFLFDRSINSNYLLCLVETELLENHKKVNILFNSLAVSTRAKATGLIHIVCKMAGVSDRSV